MISDLNKQRRLGAEHESAQKPLGRETFYRDLEKNHLNHCGNNSWKKRWFGNFVEGLKESFIEFYWRVVEVKENDNCVYNCYTMTDMERMIPVLYEKKKNVVVVLHVMLSARLLLSA